MKNKIIMLLIAITLFGYYSVDAQIQKGDVILGASSNLVGNLNQFSLNAPINSAGFYFGKYTYENEYDGHAGDKEEMTIIAFNITPSFGYMITDNLMIGLSASIYNLTFKDNGESSGLTSYSVTPTVRAYFKNEGKFLPFGELRGGIVGLKWEDDNEGDSYTMLGAKAGGSMFFNPRVALNIYADYVYAWDKEKQDDFTDKWQQGMFGLGIGFSVLL